MKLTGTLLGAALLAVAPGAVYAHCDSMDGPVVKAAQQALAASNVDLVLIWVKPADETAVRDAFSKTLSVRKLGKEARDMADMYFFETLVRLHRAGEGEPYTGIKPAGFYKGEFDVADRALRAETATELDELPQLARQKLAALRKEAHEAMRFDPANVAAGRDFVRKYTEYMHFFEKLQELVKHEAVS